jgi:hypothetical protein
VLTERSLAARRPNDEPVSTEAAALRYLDELAASPPLCEHIGRVARQTVRVQILLRTVPSLILIAPKFKIISGRQLF